MRDKPFDAAPVLASLKAFQRNTVEHVFERLYGAQAVSRFLVADEVGLGKTLVARGVIAKVLEHLQRRGKPRVDVLYICSNAAIATQNIRRLRMGGASEFSLATRLTYLPRQVHSLREKRVNFISLTPQTTFEHTRSRGGHMEERAILYRLLHHQPRAGEKPCRRPDNGLFNLLQGPAGPENWRWQVDNIPAEKLDRALAAAFRQAVSHDADLVAELEELCKAFARHREAAKIPPAENDRRYALIGRLRHLLASVCLNALEPDLIILDEFQRFKDLLHGNTEASLLAQDIFTRKDARVLLLSATPYKMYTLNAESGSDDGDDHYRDFLETLTFLFQDRDRVEEIRELLSLQRDMLHARAEGRPYSTAHKTRLEKCLLKVMCRTERVTASRDHNAMLVETTREALPTVEDLERAAEADAVARAVKAGDVLEYWKSLPCLIGFLKGYTLRRKLDACLDAPSPELRKALKAARRQWLSRNRLNRYEELEPGNARLRALFAETLDTGMWQLLWMPPALPYMQPGGAYRNREGLTKALVFSSWTAVPEAIAAICSYEAERRMTERRRLGEAPVTYGKLSDQSRPLRFAKDAKGRPTDMMVLACLLPSPALAAIDPLCFALHEGKPLAPSAMKQKVRTACRLLIRKLPQGRKTVRADKRWYWAAPLLLASCRDMLKDWCADAEGWRKVAFGAADKAAGNATDGISGFADHLDLLNSVAQGEVTLGRKPNDLADVLCDLALGGPGVCALRALRRTGAPLDAALLSVAAEVAFGLQTLFNLPETVALLQRGDTVPYWRHMLRHAADGNLQAVLDEYVHILRESLGLADCPPGEQAAKIAEHIRSVLSLRSAPLWTEELALKNGTFSFNSFSVRCRFALRFGDLRDDADQPLLRADTVREAFNSPFRPFVLASTSIGQEGLDFHRWCHAVVHWNLPANPVDMEQREGRVHRYKGHAVRKNLAEHYGLSALAEACDHENPGDPWQALFELAFRDAEAAGDASGLVPYWIFEEGSARVERRIPLPPWSREAVRLLRLRQGLALYRWVFGQPRQEDLLSSLSQEADGDGEWDDLLISLRPPPRS